MTVGASPEEAHLPDPADLPKPVVATDASKCTRRRDAVVACVHSDGTHRQKSLPQVGPVLLGKLLAIAIASFPNRPLHILGDSRATLDHIHRRTHGLRVRDPWARGHSGHPLNEAAHRLGQDVVEDPVAPRRGVARPVRDRSDTSGSWWSR